MRTSLLCKLSKLTVPVFWRAKHDYFPRTLTLHNGEKVLNLFLYNFQLILLTENILSVLITLLCSRQRFFCSVTQSFLQKFAWRANSLFAPVRQTCQTCRSPSFSTTWLFPDRKYLMFRLLLFLLLFFSANSCFLRKKWIGVSTESGNIWRRTALTHACLLHTTTFTISVIFCTAQWDGNMQWLLLMKKPLPLLHVSTPSIVGLRTTWMIINRKGLGWWNLGTTIIDDKWTINGDGGRVGGASYRSHRIEIVTSVFSVPCCWKALK